MIKYALQCEAGHGFESWFPSASSYDAQARRGLVECPQCRSIKVEKQIMAPNLRLKSADQPKEQDALPAAANIGGEQVVGLASEPMRKLRAMIREVHAHVQANTEDVGTGFADEARKIHYGESEERGIRGKATLEQAEALHDEGIHCLPLPPLPEERN
jgi:hypothetical protein